MLPRSVKRHLEIAAPIERAFAQVDDEELIKRWIGKVSDIQYADGESPEKTVGTRMIFRLAVPGPKLDIDVEIIAYDRPRRMTWLMEAAGYSTWVDYQFQQESATRTHLDYACGLVDKSPLNQAMWFVFSGLFRWQCIRQLSRLKASAEQS